MNQRAIIGFVIVTLAAIVLVARGTKRIELSPSTRSVTSVSTPHLEARRLAETSLEPVDQEPGRVVLAADSEIGDAATAAFDSSSTGTVRGIVATAPHESAEGFIVRLERPGSDTTEISEFRVLGSDGRFEFTKMPAGRYAFTWTRPDETGASGWPHVEWFDVHVAESKVLDVNAIASELCTVDVAVRHRCRPVPNVELHAMAHPMPRPTQGMTGMGSRWLLDDQGHCVAQVEGQMAYRLFVWRPDAKLPIYADTEPSLAIGGARRSRVIDLDPPSLTLELSQQFALRTGDRVHLQLVADWGIAEQMLVFGTPSTDDRSAFANWQDRDIRIPELPQGRLSVRLRVERPAPSLGTDSSSSRPLDGCESTFTLEAGTDARVELP